MIEEIRIRDLGVIEDATVELHPGLTVLTGETGAGKTMVVTGLHLLGGARARRGLSVGGDAAVAALDHADGEGDELLGLPLERAVGEGGAAQRPEAGVDVGDRLAKVPMLGLQPPQGGEKEPTSNDLCQ